MVFISFLSFYLAAKSDSLVGGTIFFGVVAVFVAYFWGAGSKETEINRVKSEICKVRRECDEAVQKERCRSHQDIQRRVQGEYRLELERKDRECLQKLNEKEEECRRKVRWAERKQTEAEKERKEWEVQAQKAIDDRWSVERKFESSVALLRRDCMEFPSVAERLDMLLAKQDEVVIRMMNDRAKTSREEVSRAKAERRQYLQECLLLRSRLEVYRSLAPWLEDYMDCTLDELLKAKHEEDKASGKYADEPIFRYVTQDEYNKLSEGERNQLALDRYWSKSVRHNLWLIGIQYERYVGYLYEQAGFKVEYEGALKGKEDSGIDLIATARNGTVHVIQCKRYSEVKRIPVRENTVAQIYGATRHRQVMEGWLSIKPVLVTSFELSEKAREFAKALDVEFREHVALEKYPCIKCNIGKDGEKIYHLPFDQMYDKVVIEPEKGECYVKTVAEAEQMGFRRAYRWRGRHEV